MFSMKMLPPLLMGMIWSAVMTDALPGGVGMTFFEKTVTVRFVDIPELEFRSHLFLLALNIVGNFDDLEFLRHLSDCFYLQNLPDEYIKPFG